MFTNIIIIKQNLNDLALNHTPVSLKTKSNIVINSLTKKCINWNNLRNLMTTQTSLNLKLKNFVDINNVKNTFTKKIKSTDQMSSSK